MKNIINKIFNQKELSEKPPVLIDIGASEKIHYKWKHIAKYSTCIAFDADERDFKFIEQEKSKFKRLIVYNKIASDTNVSKADFYLTKSPYCSSLLKPNHAKLKPYLNSHLFEVEKKVELNSIHIQKVIDNTNIDYVDWIKIDSQGIDLRLFNSLDEKIRNKIIVAEFEPGIIDAYIGEDKLYSILEELNKSSFWLSDIKIKGVARLSKELFHNEFKGNVFKKFIKESIKKAPGWGELTFINTFENSRLTKREYLLGWLFSTLEKHHSFAFVLADNGYKKFKSEVFNEMKIFSKIQMRREVYRLKFLPSIVELITKKFSL